jgi:hypothetical protein
MKNNFKYLTVGEEDRNWDLFLNVAGSSDVKPGSNYPCTNLPSGYHFNWDAGRVLHKFQINYITQSAGIYEKKFGKFAIKPGSIFKTSPPNIRNGFPSTINWVQFPVFENMIFRV